MARKRELEAAALDALGLTTKQIAERMKITENGARGMKSKGKRAAGNVIEDTPPKRGLFTIINEKRLDVPRIQLMPMVNANEMIVTGDWHVPTSNWQYLETMCEFGGRHMRKGSRRLALVGDLFNFDVLSSYDHVLPTVGVAHELNAAEAVLDYVMEADSISPVMCTAFTFLRNGTANLLTPYASMTDWSMWKMANVVKEQVLPAAA